MVPSQRSNEPENAERFTREWDRAYTVFARPYDLAVRVFPTWKRWLRHALPHIQGPRVLEVSFGTGYLLSQYAGAFETHGIDYNRKMVTVARKNLARVQRSAALVRGDVQALPYADASFGSVVNTMAFSGYPSGEQALGEMARVLRPGGRLILIDVTFPPDQNWLGSKIAALIATRSITSTVPLPSWSPHSHSSPIPFPSESKLRGEA